MRSLPILIALAAWLAPAIGWAQGLFPVAAFQTDQTAPVFIPAPVPNRGVSPPAGAPERDTASLSPTFFASPTQRAGAGFPPKSSSLEEQDQRTRPIPGVNLKLPLQ